MAVAGWADRPLELLEFGGEEGKRCAAMTLRHLAASGPEHRRQMVSEGVVPLLLDLLSRGSPEAKAEAAGAIRVLSTSTITMQQIAASNSLPLLVSLLLSEDAGVPEQIAGTLMNMSSENKEYQKAIAAMGAVPILINLIRSKVVMLFLSVTNVDIDLDDHEQESYTRFCRETRKAVAEEIDNEVSAKHVMLNLAPGEPDKSMAVQIKSVFVTCTVTVKSRVDAEALQAAMRQSELSARLTEALTEAKLRQNPLRPIEVSKVTTPATLNFEIHISGLNMAKLQATSNLLMELQDCVGDAVVEETGFLVPHVCVSIFMMAGSDIVHCTILPIRQIDVVEVLPLLRNPEGLMKRLPGFIENAREDGPNAGDDNPLQDVITGPIVVTFISLPVMKEAVYERSGTRGAQRLAAGALKNLVCEDFHNQELVVAEDGVPALVALLQPYVPFGDIFKSIDKDNSGSISFTEFNCGVVNMGFAGDITALWYALDTDGSGDITWDEFVDRLGTEFAAQSQGKGVSKRSSTVIVDFLAFMQVNFDSSPVQEEAAGALRDLVHDNLDAADVVNAAGAVPPLIELMKSPAPEVREAANTALKVIAPTWTSKVVQRLRQGPPREREEAAKSLRRLAAVNAEHRKTVVAAGAVEPLVELVSSEDGKCREMAIGALHTLLYRNHDHLKVINQAGAIPLFVKALGSDLIGEVGEAMRAVRMIVPGGDMRILKKMVEAGLIEVLVALIKAKGMRPILQQRALEMLMVLSKPAEFEKRFQKAEIPKVVLDFSNSTDDDDARAAAEELHALLVVETE